MAFRKHRAGETVIEQTRDLARVRVILEQGGMTTDGIEWPPACYLIAFDGDGAVGVVGVEPMLDAALIRSLYVSESHRKRGLGARLVAAARKAAHTRGARTLYLFAYPQLAGFFQRLGFTEIEEKQLIGALGGTPEVQYHQERPGQLATELAFVLDISQDGIIDRS
ncbi:MAG: GNAT family N-acetyltransferase [Candidatus Binataceae bacterium]